MPSFLSRTHLTPARSRSEKRNDTHRSSAPLFSQGKRGHAKSSHVENHPASPLFPFAGGLPPFPALARATPALHLSSSRYFLPRTRSTVLSLSPILSLILAFSLRSRLPLPGLDASFPGTSCAEREREREREREQSRPRFRAHKSQPRAENIARSLSSPLLCARVHAPLCIRRPVFLFLAFSLSPSVAGKQSEGGFNFPTNLHVATNDFLHLEGPPRAFRSYRPGGERDGREAKGEPRVRDGKTTLCGDFFCIIDDSAPTLRCQFFPRASSVLTFLLPFCISVFIYIVVGALFSKP